MPTIDTTANEQLTQSGRRRVRAADEAVMALSNPIANSQAKSAWAFACWGLIPIVGLPLGLLSLIFGIAGWWRVYRQPDDLGIRHAIGGVILGSMETLVNIAGIGCIIRGAMALL